MRSGRTFNCLIHSSWSKNEKLPVPDWHTTWRCHLLIVTGFRSVVVITSALHAEDRGFEPSRKQFIFLLWHYNLLPNCIQLFANLESCQKRKQNKTKNEAVAMNELLKVFILQQHHIRIDAIRLPHTSKFFVIELQIFCRRTADFLSDSNRDKICRDIRLPNLVSRVDILSRLKATAH